MIIENIREWIRGGKPDPYELGRRDCMGDIAHLGVRGAEGTLDFIPGGPYRDGYASVLERARTGADYIRHNTTTPGLE